MSDPDDIKGKKVLLQPQTTALGLFDMERVECLVEFYFADFKVRQLSDAMSLSTAVSLEWLRVVCWRGLPSGGPV